MISDKNFKYFLKIASVIILLNIALIAYDKNNLQVFIIHGKAGKSENMDNWLGNYLRNIGYDIYTPDMPWSKTRYIDKSYEDSLTELNSYITAKMKNNHNQKLIIIGHSMGANGALAYATKYHVDGLILLAPGHYPKNQTKIFGESINRAKNMIDKNSGDEYANFDDINGGPVISRFMKANIYYSFFSPNGLSNMGLNAKHIVPNIPILYIVGLQDPLTQKNGTEIFDNLQTKNKKYEILNSNHIDVPKDSRELIRQWLENL